MVLVDAYPEPRCGKVGVNRVGNSFIVVHPVLPTVPKGLSTASAQRMVDAHSCFPDNRQETDKLRQVALMLQDWHFGMSAHTVCIKMSHVATRCSDCHQR